MKIRKPFLILFIVAYNFGFCFLILQKLFGRSGTGSLIVFENLFLNLGVNVGVLDKILLCVFTALCDPVSVIGDPCACLIYYVRVDRHIENNAFGCEALAVDHIVFRLLEGGSDLVFNDLDLCILDDYLAAFFYRVALSYIETDGGVEFKRHTAGCRFGIAEHYADLFTKLVYKYYDRVCLVDDAGQLS